MRFIWQSKIRFRIHCLPGGGSEPVGKLRFGSALGLEEGGAKIAVVGQRFQPAQLAEVGYPAVADGLGDGARERGIRQQQPAARRDAVGLVVEPLRKHLGQIFHRHCAQQSGMNRGHTVGAVRADDGQIRHPDLAPRDAFFDQADSRDSVLVSGETGSDVVKQPTIDFINDFQVPRHHELEPRQRPFLECFGEQRVVGVCQSLSCDVPGFVPAESGVVQQNPHEFGDGQGRVCIVELDGDFFGKHAPVGVALSEAPDQIRQRAGNQEILLHETEALPHAGGVVRVQHPCQCFGRERFSQAPTKSPLLNS